MPSIKYDQKSQCFQLKVGSFSVECITILLIYFIIVGKHFYKEMSKF